MKKRLLSVGAILGIASSAIGQVFLYEENDSKFNLLIEGQLSYALAGTNDGDGINDFAGEQGLGNYWVGTLTVTNVDAGVESSITGISFHRPYAGTTNEPDAPLDSASTGGVYFFGNIDGGALSDDWNIHLNKVLTGSNNVKPLQNGHDASHYVSLAYEGSMIGDGKYGINEGETGTFSFLFYDPTYTANLNNAMYDLVEDDIFFRIRSIGEDNEESEKLGTPLELEETNPIPEPSTVGFLSALGLIGFAGLRRSLKRSQN